MKSPTVLFLATFQEIFFSKLLTKFRELFSTIKLSRDVHEWCTSRGHEPVSILYKYPHVLAEKSHLPLKSLEKHQVEEDIGNSLGC